jgi:hypothetical protein
MEAEENRPNATTTPLEQLQKEAELASLKKA